MRVDGRLPDMGRLQPSQEWMNIPTARLGAGHLGDLFTAVRPIAI